MAQGQFLRLYEVFRPFLKRSLPSRSVNLKSNLWCPQFFQKRTKITIVSTYFSLWGDAQDSNFCSFFGRIDEIFCPLVTRLKMKLPVKSRAPIIKKVAL